MRSQAFVETLLCWNEVENPLVLVQEMSVRLVTSQTRSAKVPLNLFLCGISNHGC
jgi:hypothetical protein